MAKDLAHLSDEALVALVARGDEQALAALYDRVGRVAYGIAYRILRDDRLAEDAVQEGFLAVWRSAATFRADRGKASTWIVTLVHRKAVDIVRREQRRRAEPLEVGPAQDVADPSGSAEDEAWLVFERDRVQSALRALPDAQRETLELAYYGGYSQSELAAKLGVPLGTIKSRMFAGLTRLRELLEDTGEKDRWSSPKFMH
jgi:RNA polymerase sigma-70 factor, ECF subfamily